MLDQPTYYSGKRVNGTVIVNRRDERRMSRLNPRFDLARHSPDGFEWGYEGSGPAQLALALLCDATGDDQLSLRVYQEFKREIVARMGETWGIHARCIVEFANKLDARKTERADA